MPGRSDFQEMRTHCHLWETWWKGKELWDKCQETWAPAWLWRCLTISSPCSRSRCPALENSLPDSMISEALLVLNLLTGLMTQVLWWNKQAGRDTTQGPDSWAPQHCMFCPSISAWGQGHAQPPSPNSPDFSVLGLGDMESSGQLPTSLDTLKTLACCPGQVELQLCMLPLVKTQAAPNNLSSTQASLTQATCPLTSYDSCLCHQRPRMKHHHLNKKLLRSSCCQKMYDWELKLSLVYAASAWPGAKGGSVVSQGIRLKFS